MLKKNDVGPQAYRDAMAKFAGHVHIITTDGAAGLRGATVTASCSVSDTPPILLVCLNRENLKNEVFLANGRFALNTLGKQHQPVAAAISGQTGLASMSERFKVGTWDVIATGAPTLIDAIAVFDCEIIDTKDIATHRIYFGRVAGLRLGKEQPPLLYHDRHYTVLDDKA
ncbi:flavin reductase [Aquamicrobium segne]|uniref:Flavin reductase n=1 Tax=Aquamicrobium segne TaxID=469547 RepID=A0ABW0GWL0_9HYPH